MRVAGLQTWPLVQSVLARHATQLFATRSHLSFGAVHVVPSIQPTHYPFFAPFAVTHAGPPAVPAQSAALVHAWQTCVLVSHVGVIPAQSLFALHPTHEPLGTSQTCEPPVH